METICANFYRTSVNVPETSMLSGLSVDFSKKLIRQRTEFIRKDTHEEFSLKSKLFVHILLAEEIVKIPACTISLIVGKILFHINFKVGDIGNVKASFQRNKVKGALHFALFAIFQAANATKILFDATAILATKAAVVAAVALPFVLIAIPLIFIPIVLVPLIGGVELIGSLAILILAYKINSSYVQTTIHTHLPRRH